MSKIHQALQETNSAANPRQRRNFNPLSTTGSARSKRVAGYYGLALMLFIAAALVIFWPAKPSPQDLPLSRTVPPQTEVDSAATVQARAEPIAVTTEPATQPASTAGMTAAEPETGHTVAAEEAPATEQLQTVQITEPLVADPVAEPKPEPEPEPEQATEIAQPNQTPAQPEAAEGITATATANTTTTTATAPPVRAEPVAEPKPMPVAQPEPTIQATTQPAASIQPAAATQQPVSAIPAKPEAGADPVNPEPVATAQPAEDAPTSVIQKSQAKWQSEIQSHIANGNMAQAEAQLKQWIGAIPGDPTPRIWLARIYISKGLHQAAEPMVSGLKDNTEASALLGIIYEKTSRPKLAASTFEKLYRSQPENNRWLLFWAVNSENSRELVIAKTLYQNYLERFAAVDAGLAQFAQSRLQALGGVK
ncbi:tetratricopeptide repeat protein [Reinekea marinisedimentorum]|uniref:MSHA biogenesis protein MshN n=1 Tax=Reinekea marinisedimentorum TaxID=230495 RepID=A0A4R3IC39_9GAMM|nr:hypothetical protein [Reinekea marinisedimentorum]TCS43185.1 hypothetical protein BCF53_102211 [Reinekea marinisedimentorum]